jgi:hypothetical protein
MRKLLIWPCTVAVIFLLVTAYGFISPCRDGLFIGSCGAGNAIFAEIAIFDILLYALLAGLYSVFCHWKRRTISAKILFFLGLFSILLLYLGFQYLGFVSFILLWTFSKLFV